VRGRWVGLDGSAPVALRAGHGNGRGQPRVEVLPVDELPAPVSAATPPPDVALAFRQDGKIADSETAREMGLMADGHYRETEQAWRAKMADRAAWMRAQGIIEIHSGDIKLVVSPYKPDPEPVVATEQAFGIPEALQAAKDTEAQRLQAERDAQWADDQVRYAASEGYRES
jgi:hypothetical protein